MHQKISNLFHLVSKDKMRGHPPIPIDSWEWPEEWRTVHYKTYPRFPRVQLPRPKPTSDLFDMILHRVSRKYFGRIPISLHDLATLLLYSCGETNNAPDYHRAQPSGGGRYPIETYVLLFRPLEKEVLPGIYHYAVGGHTLELLWEHTFSEDEIGNLFAYPWMKQTAAVFIYTSIFERNQVKYGERGYRYILIEAGHIGQNLYLAAESLGLSCCAMGGTQDRLIEELLNIDGVSESLINAIGIGGQKVQA